MLSVLTVLVLSFAVHAQDRFELGIGAGTTNPVAQDAFKSAASPGNAQLYWLGYGLDKNWGVELGLDQADFDKINSKHKALSLAGVYRFLPEKWVHPIAKLGLTSVESTSTLNAKINSFGLKVAAGLEADAFKYVSIGALFDYLYITKSDDVADFKDTQAFIPAVFLTIHNALDNNDEESKSTAPEATTATAAPVAKDTDGDGVSDDDDKCPNTPVGVAVNKIGCSEKEKASAKLNVEFALGKSDLTSASDGAIQNLAAFMKKFPETTAEIAGHSDNVGAAEFNNSLSQKRAESVKQALVKAGIESSRLTAKGYGSSRPVASNKTKVGRDENRRVTAEISISVDKKK